MTFLAPVLRKNPSGFHKNKTSLETIKSELNKGRDTLSQSFLRPPLVHHFNNKDLRKSRLDLQ